MKSLTISFLFSLICAVSADDKISPDKFEQLDRAARLKIIDSATSEQKKVLERVEQDLESRMHSLLVRKFGGEEGLKYQREEFVIEARGFLPIERLFSAQVNYLSSYVSGEHERSGVTNDQLEKKIQDLVKREVYIIHPLVLHLAPSVEAQDLEKRIKEVGNQFAGRLAEISSARGEFVTKKQLDEITGQAERVIEELRRLPRLSEKDVQRESDAYPEDKVLDRTSSWGP